MKCPICGQAELVHDTRDIPYTYKSEVTHAAAVVGDYCPACSESILGVIESDRVMYEKRSFNLQVDAMSVNNPTNIKEDGYDDWLRKRLAKAIQMLDSGEMTSSPIEEVIARRGTQRAI